MKTKSKVLLLSLCAVLLVAATVMGTVAYLTSQAEVTNTFTVGDVQIKLDEAVVDKNGNPAGGRTDQGNDYHLIPGQTYTKDPTVTVLANSENSYVRMLVTLNNYADLKTVFGDNFLPQNYVSDWDKETWVPVLTPVIDTAKDTITYEFRYNGIVPMADKDTELEPLFETFTLPGTVDNADLKLLNDPAFEIKVVGHAIQSATFKDADEAWAAFDEQMK